MDRQAWRGTDKFGDVWLGMAGAVGSGKARRGKDKTGAAWQEWKGVVGFRIAWFGWV